MSRPLVSIVLATYNRAHLLWRSIAAYNRMAFPLDRLEVVVIDDHSDQLSPRGTTRQLMAEFHKDIRWVYLTPGPKTEAWRDCGAILNHGIRAAAGEHILLTHPEIIPGRRSVAACVEQLVEFDERRKRWAWNSHPDKSVPSGWRMSNGDPLPFGLYVACKCYYLSPREQALIDTVPWRDQGNLAVRQLPGFYDEDGNGNPDYTHAVADKVATPGFRIKTWDSFVFSGHSRETWKRLGGLKVSQRWGSVDILWNDRRKKLGMAEWTCPEDESIVVHQSHDTPNDVPTPRDESVWARECAAIDHTKLCYPDVDELWGS